MIDQDIIKAAECCLEMKCTECPLQTYSFDTQICRSKCKTEQIFLLRRLELENDRLREHCLVYQGPSYAEKVVVDAFGKFFDKARCVSFPLQGRNRKDLQEGVRWDDLVEIYKEMVGENYEGN